MDVEFLNLMLYTAQKHRHSEYQKDVSDHGARKRCLNDIEHSLFHGDKSDYELGRVSESSVQEAADLLPAVAGDVICALAHHTRQRDYRKRTEHEEQRIGEARYRSVYGHRYEYQKYVKIFHLVLIIQ